MFESISSPVQRGLEQRQFNLQHAPPRPQDPPSYPSQPSQFQPNVDRGFFFGVRLLQLSCAALSQSSTIPCSRNLAFVRVGSSAQGPHRPCDQTRRLQARLSLFSVSQKPHLSRRTLLLSAWCEGLFTTPPLPICSSLLVLRPSFCTLSFANLAICTRGRAIDRLGWMSTSGC